MPRAPTPWLLLEVWKETCRHLEIEKSVASLKGIIDQALPLQRLIIRLLEMNPPRIVTIACAGPLLTDSPQARDLGKDELAALLEFIEAGKASDAGSAALAPIRAAVLPPGLQGKVVIGPLEDAKNPGGIAIFEGDEEVIERISVLQLLLEPFSTAIANDRRLHEINRLREAAEADNRALLSRLQREDIAEVIVGATAGLKQVMERVERVGGTDAPVLILGETGSGKEVVARAVHSSSRRKGGPFLRVNCGAIPTELVDSELFGHERGSFTGAVSPRKGWFERADGGTLFLDEVGELSLAAQVRLLRVLQDGTFDRVGGQQTRTVDVRIIAATHRDIHALVTEKLFREDLWYRISVFPIELPALRDRRQDIRSLAGHFAERAGRRLYGLPLTPTEDDVRVLEEYGWPGNVRELASVIERAAILGGGRHLAVREALGAYPSRNPVSPAESAAPTPERELDRVVSRHIESVLQQTQGRIEGKGGAADLLGINPHTLRSRMRKFGIDWAKFRTSRVD